MSRAFVRESDNDGPDELPDWPVSLHPNYVTARGLALLQGRLRDSEAQLKRIDVSAVDGRLERAAIVRDLRWLRTRLASAQLRTPRPICPPRVEFGVEVELRDDTGQHYRYRIVGEDEADPEHGYLSWVSPLARALSNAAVGESVSWQRPAGERQVEIIRIDNGEPEPG